MAWFLLILVILQVTLIWRVVLLQNRDPGKTVAWFFILSCIPILGFLLYVIFGQKAQGPLFKHKHIPDNYLANAISWQENEANYSSFFAQYDIGNQNSVLLKKLASLFLHSGYAPLTVHNRVEILTNGNEKFQALFNALEGAKNHIHLSYYIFKDDEIGADVLKILSRKVAEGIEVRVLLDGLGGLSVAGSFMRSMRKAGIQAEWFFPVRFPFISSKLNFRYHRKIAVVDGSTGFIGGLNIGDEYLSRNAKSGFWRDTHIKLEGDSVHSLQAIFLNDWYFAARQKVQGEYYFPSVNILQNTPIQIIAGGPDSNWSTNLQGFVAAINMAKRKIYIETPYFIPEESLLMALKTAALSGLDVRIIVQGIPDHKITYWAMHSYFEELLQTGIKIYSYIKGTLHAKILLIDEHIASVGSTNVDMRSFYLDFEICAFMYDQSLVERLRIDFAQDLNDSEEYVLNNFRGRPSMERYKESAARLFSPLL